VADPIAPVDPSPLLFDSTEESLLDLVDNLLNRGVVLDAELVLGLAGVDLVYVHLNALLCAADRVLPRQR
jgi:Gas vesicle protein